MSRLAQSAFVPAVRREARPAGSDSPDEICPVCKSSRYLNPNLRFLVNPECYHKMCASCVDRIFSHGPAQCPIAGCTRTLRKPRFREQTFEDLKVEREVDIRRKVAAVFNRREDEFEDTRAYNDYLNDVEDITFNLINGIDLEDTERKFADYERAHADEIKENAELESQEQSSYRVLQKKEREQIRLRREAARREEEEDKRLVEENRREQLRRLAAGQDASVVEKDGQQVQLKRRMDRRAAEERQRQLHARDAPPTPVTNGATPFIKGLKQRKGKEAEPPVDAFDGIRYKHQYYSLQDDYTYSFLDNAKKDARILAGGYNVHEYNERALADAFAGLGVFIADEVTERAKLSHDIEVPTEMAATEAQDVKMEDPV
ncbi:CDK-activating kinase assembly factor [Polychaeton citri CBS 116435]|uniref:RNA polymerase II transcription factor B subunit 3 n=1 Tax=Polychaeton citri CBS 116435 TaxID=1314669 RepID=A0A9P4QK08_9PEZI|nr:CDK-activating kinase assembly factor [Polychaeton citri CBS 116435]